MPAPPFIGRLVEPWRSVIRDPSGRLLVLGLGAGVLGGLAAGAFDALRAGVASVTLGATDASVASAPWWLTLLLPAVGGGIAALVLQLAGVERPAGMAGLLERIQLRGGRAPLRESAATALSAAVALGTGHSGGREAPVASLAAGAVHALTEPLHLRPGEARLLVACAAAAGVSASFNTPLGSALIALELLLGSFALRNFGPVVAATVAGTLVGQALLGERVAFHAPGFVLSHPLELLAYAGLGLFCGALSAGYQVAIVGMDRVADRLGGSPVAHGVAAGLGVGVLGAVGMHRAMGTGYAVVEEVLADPGALGIPLLVGLLLAKLAATLVTWGGRTGPGLFTPMLVLGAIAGSAYGVALEQWLPLPVGGAGSYGLVAMAAVTAASQRAPLSMALVLFELTGDYSVVPTVLLTIAIALPVSDALMPGSIYDAQLRSRGVALHPEIPPELRARTVGDLERRDGISTVAEHPTLDEVVHAFHETRENLVWCLDAGGHYRGAVDIQDALDALADARSVTVPALVQVLPSLRADQPASDALELLGGLEVDEVAVVDAEGRFQGVLHERELILALRQGTDDGPQ